MNNADKFEVKQTNKQTNKQTKNNEKNDIVIVAFLIRRLKCI